MELGKEILKIVITIVLTLALTQLWNHTFLQKSNKLSITTLESELQNDNMLISSDSISSIFETFNQKIIFKNDGDIAIEKLKIAISIPKSITLIDSIKISSIPKLNINTLTIKKEKTAGLVRHWEVDLLNRANALVYEIKLRKIASDTNQIESVASGKDLIVSYTNKEVVDTQPFKIWFYVSLTLLIIVSLILVVVLRVIYLALNAVVRMFMNR